MELLDESTGVQQGSTQFPSLPKSDFELSCKHEQKYECENRAFAQSRHSYTILCPILVSINK